MSAAIIDENSDVEIEPPVDNVSTYPPVRDLIVLSKCRVIANDVVINLGGRYISHPDTVKDASEEDLFHSRLFYNELFSKPNGSVFAYDCTKLEEYRVKSRNKYVTRVNGHLVVTKKFVKNNSQLKKVYTVRNAKKQQVYLFSDKEKIIPTAGCLSSAYAVENKHVSPDYVHTLETMYSITNFLTEMPKYHFDKEFGSYRTEILEFTKHAFWNYRKRAGLIQLPEDENDVNKSKTVLGYHKLTTFYNYSSYMKKVYYYFLNFDKFVTNQNIPDEYVERSAELRENLLDIYDVDGKIDDEKIEERMVLFRKFLWDILNDANANMFTLPIKAAMIDDLNYGLQKDTYCLKVMDGVKFMMKYLFIFNPPGVDDNEIPHEFSTLFIEDDNKHFKQFKNVYHGVFKVTDFTTNTEIHVDDDGEISIDGISFSKERMMSCYNHLFEEYDKHMADLFSLGVDLDSVQSVSSLAISKYKPQKDAFYNCFDGNTVFVKRYKPVNTSNPVVLKKIWDAISGMSAAMLLMLHFSAGGSYRLFEMSYFNMDNLGTIMKLYQPADGKSYLHIVSGWYSEVVK